MIHIGKCIWMRTDRSDMNQEENEYLKLLQKILDHGCTKKDRTGVGTKSIFGANLTFDLSRGFPLLTTKKVFFKGVVHELLWFLKGSTNIKYLNDNGVHIWDEWAGEDGNLGPIYGKQWRAWQDIKFIEPKIKDKPSPNQFVTQFNKNIVCDYAFDQHGLVGKTFVGNYGEFTVIKEYKEIDRGAKRSFFDVQFSKSGYIAKRCRQNFNKTFVRDPYYPSVVGIGCMGEPSKEDVKLLYQTWVGILKRCYDPKHIGYGRYGDRGIFVDNEWLNFANFARDVKSLPGWSLKKVYPKEYTLDKDIKCSNYYSKDTCLWISIQEQSINIEGNEAIKVTRPEGTEFITMGFKKLCADHELTSSSVSSCLRGDTLTHKGWKFERIDIDGLIPRTRIYDQIKSVIAEIIVNPNSRRLYISAWNVDDLNDMKLPPCHVSFEFCVNNGNLDCLFIMRSCDVFLGLPFNIASYSLLTYMIAQVTNLKPGKLIFMGGDVHLYLNHLEQTKELLARAPFEFPKIELNQNIKNIDDFTINDFILKNYVCHPSIKAPIAV